MKQFQISIFLITCFYFKIKQVFLATADRNDDYYTDINKQIIANTNVLGSIKNTVPDTDENKLLSHNPPLSNILITSKSQNRNLNDTYFQIITSNNDKIIFPNEETISMDSFTKDEIQCFSQKQVYYNESCHELLERENCNEGEWLVLDLKSAILTPPKITPKCEKQMCKYFQFYWPKTRTCFNYSDSNIDLLCRPGNVVQTDVFGYGACKCKTTYGLYVNGSCFKLYTQGPCSNGYLFVENDNKETECIKNPCKNTNLIPWKNGSDACYTLEEQGPCENNFIFQVSEITKKPECIDTLEFEGGFGGPYLCVTNGGSECVKETHLQEQSKQYIDKIISQSKIRARH
ncbi:uncharacterized protein LOC142320909 isoform X2 [Lycorma delicatula]